MTETLVARLTAALTGRYAIEREIGQGGMATVYLARDLRHDRKVALKVLRPELAAVIGADRFLQEIRVTAGLQHPHILPLHDSGEIDHFLYYVMPFVEGESLRDRLARERQLSIEDALRIAGEVLAALAYAHGRGVIHRDIKPENILLGASGAAVVADFGIARAVTAAGGGRLTETGLSLGTPQYMSPEQATADRELDGRSDVYALGAVLYEMLTGEPPHTGPTTQSVIAKLLTEEPRPVLAGRPTVPPHVAAAVHKSLARLPADRFRGAADFAEALTRPGSVAAIAPARVATPRNARPLLAGAGLLLLAVALAIWAVLRTPAEAPPAPLIRSVLKLPADAGIQPLAVGIPVAISPDETSVVYVGRQQLFLRRLDQLDPVPLPNSRGALQPFFSPDGHRIGFVAEGSLKQVALAGGPAVTLCPVQGVSGAAWGSRDVIVFSSDGKLFQVPASGGTARPVALIDSAKYGTLRWPNFLPDGKRVLANSGVAPSYEAVIVELETGRVTPVAGAGLNPRYSEAGGGSLVSFAVEGSAMVAPFDWRRGRVSGPAVPVLDGVPIGLQGTARVGISRGGWAVYAPEVSTRRRLVLVNRHGTETMLGTEARSFLDPRFSPSGRQVAVTSLAPGAGLAGDIWILDLAQTTLARLTFEGQQQFADWSSDGRRVLFTSRRGGGGIQWAPAGGGEMDSLLADSLQEIYEGVLTRDQRTLVYRVGGIPGDLYFVRRDSLGSPHPLVVTRFDERAPALSPNERWLAYVSNETGRDEVYVRPFPGGGGRWLVSAAGGTEPRWRRDGRELFYRNADSMFAVPVLAQPDFAIGPRALLFIRDYLTNGRHATYDVHPDGNQFIFITGEPEVAGELILVQNLVASVARPGGRGRRP
jgi:tRNA A-37 threonylcarbamoyl transferase component Bud32